MMKTTFVFMLVVATLIVGYTIGYNDNDGEFREKVKDIVYGVCTRIKK